MNTDTAASPLHPAPAGAQLPAVGASTPAPAPPLAAPSGPRTVTPSELTAAAVVTLPLALVRRVGADTAVAWALLQHIGHYDRQRIARAMGIPTMDARIHYARLARLGLVPDEHPAAGSAATHEPERETAGEKE